MEYRFPTNVRPVEIVETDRHGGRFPFVALRVTLERFVQDGPLRYHAERTTSACYGDNWLGALNALAWRFSDDHEARYGNAGGFEWERV